MKTLILILALINITACGTIKKNPKLRLYTAPIELAMDYHAGQNKPQWKTSDETTTAYAKEWAAKNDPEGKLIKVGF